MYTAILCFGVYISGRCFISLNKTLHEIASFYVCHAYPDVGYFRFYIFFLIVFFLVSLDVVFIDIFECELFKDLLWAPVLIKLISSDTESSPTN